MLLNTLFRHWTYQLTASGGLIRKKYEAFKDLIEKDTEAHDCIAELEEIYYGRKLCGFSRVDLLTTTLCDAVGDMVNDLEIMSPMEYMTLRDYYRKINFYIRFMLAPPDYDISPPYTMSQVHADVKKETLQQKTGGKGANLFVMARDLGLPVPRFFIITTNSFYYFLEYNKLHREISSLLSNIDLTHPETLEKYSNKLVSLIKSADIPPEIRKAVAEETDRLSVNGHMPAFWSVRSSAVAEDSETSFAGQYLTRLNIPASDLVEGYREVLASKYSASAICYRIMHGLLDVETPMAAVVQEMADPVTAGILYTKDPSGIEGESIVIHAVPGLGEAAVNGEVSPDLIYVSRNTPHVITHRKLGTKHVKLVCSDSGEIVREPIPMEEQHKISIDDKTALELARWGMKSEEFFHTVQDMEWCMDKHRGLQCLQTRPLGSAVSQDKVREKPHINASPVLHGTVTASPGTGAGPAFVIQGRAHLSDVMDGAVLVARNVPPAYASVFSYISAIISEEAVSASHAATVAREAGIPFLSGVKQACKTLKTGEIITVDADEMCVYPGMQKELLKHATTRPFHELMKDSPFMHRMKYIMGFISQLNLINQDSPDFKPESCRTMHDILRFCHEKAMQEMFMLGDRKRGSASGAKRLIGDLPINFYVLNVGNGIEQSAAGKKQVTIDDIISVPMRKLWEGLSDPAIKWAEGEHFDWREYDSVVLGGGIINRDSPSLASYGIVSSDYVNLSIRFGYHFVVIDALSTEIPSSNYITFRFSGGGGDDEGRFRRAEFLKIVLEKLGFEVDLKGELIDASFKHGTQETINSILPVLGRLLGSTRLMDMRLTQDDDIEELASEFMKGRCDFASE